MREAWENLESADASNCIGEFKYHWILMSQMSFFDKILPKWERNLIHFFDIKSIAVIGEMLRHDF